MLWLGSGLVWCYCQGKFTCYTCYTCPASRFVMSLAVGMQGQKAYGLCTTPLCAVLVVQFFP